MEKKNRAFHGKRLTKIKMVRRARQHRKADRFRKGTYGYWAAMNGHAEFRGCAVGCLSQPVTMATVRMPEHVPDWTNVDGDGKVVIYDAEHPILTRMKNAETPATSTYDSLMEQTGFSYGFCMLLDNTFEGMPAEKAGDFPLAAMKALRVGKDVSDEAVEKFEEDQQRKGNIHWESDVLLDWLARA